MKIAITGSGGFIGKNLLQDLSPDYQITAFARGGSVPEFVITICSPGFEVAICDFTDSQSIAALADKLGKKLDAVIYLSGNGDPAYSVTHPAVDLTDYGFGIG